LLCIRLASHGKTNQKNECHGRVCDGPPERERLVAGTFDANLIPTSPFSDDESPYFIPGCSLRI